MKRIFSALAVALATLLVIGGDAVVNFGGAAASMTDAAPAAYGRYNNVILTDTELSGLKTELPDKWEYYIDRLSCHIASTGKQYHSHAATIYKWAQEDAAKGKAAPKQGIPDYSCKEGESL